MYIVMAVVITTGEKFVAECCDSQNDPPHTKLYRKVEDAVAAAKEYRKLYNKCTFFTKNLGE